MEQYSKELACDVDSPRLRAALFERDSDIDHAIRELEDLVEKGSSFAMVALGNIYLYGSHGIHRDEKEGEALLARSAQLGSIEGAYRLACFLDSRSRHEEAFEIYEDLARRKFSPALYRLGWAYDVGRWVMQDKAKARELFFAAYKEGHILAQQKLSFDLRKSSELPEKIHGYFLLLTLSIPRGLQYIRQPLSDRLRD